MLVSMKKTFIILSNILPNLNAEREPKIKPITPDKTHETPISANDDIARFLTISITGLYIY
ncbi:Uncharacterised protein [Streptobacillus moniliformis]|nr:Uncharacterised protein [Streptobacillus moniliformis]